MFYWGNLAFTVQFGDTGCCAQCSEKLNKNFASAAQMPFMPLLGDSCMNLNSDFSTDIQI